MSRSQHPKELDPGPVVAVDPGRAAQLQADELDRAMGESTAIRDEATA